MSPLALSASASGSNSKPAPCDLFAAVYGNQTENGTVVPSQMLYYENYTVIFSEICGTPSFVSVYSHVNSTGDFGVGWGGKIGALPTLSFTLSWLGACTNTSPAPEGFECVFEAVWSGYLTNNSYSGPAVTEYPDVYSVGVARTGSQSPGFPVPTLVLGAAVAGVSVAILAVFDVRKRRKSELAGARERPARGVSGDGRVSSEAPTGQPPDRP